MNHMLTLWALAFFAGLVFGRAEFFAAVVALKLNHNFAALGGIPDSILISLDSASKNVLSDEQV